MKHDIEVGDYVCCIGFDSCVTVLSIDVVNNIAQIEIEEIGKGFVDYSDLYPIEESEWY